VLKNGSAAVWDIGDGVLCFEFTSKSNSLDEASSALLGKTIRWSGEVQGAGDLQRGQQFLGAPIRPRHLRREHRGLERNRADGRRPASKPTRR
jgi:hypothetical protein